MSARMRVPPERAARALDLVRLDLVTRQQRRAGNWIVHAGDGHIELTHGGLPLEPRNGRWTWPLRQLFGVLRAPAMYRIDVELEVVPWSDRSTELGLRPIGRWPPRVRSVAPYFRVAERALVLLGTEMLAWNEAATDPGGLVVMRRAC